MIRINKCYQFFATLDTRHGLRYSQPLSLLTDNLTALSWCTRKEYAYFGLSCTHLRTFLDLPAQVRQNIYEHVGIIID